MSAPEPAQQSDDRTVPRSRYARPILHGIVTGALLWFSICGGLPNLIGGVVMLISAGFGGDDQSSTVIVGLLSIGISLAIFCCTYLWVRYSRQSPRSAQFRFGVAQLLVVVTVIAVVLGIAMLIVRSM